MIFRVIRRAPWLAIGAAAAYYMDPDNGSARRADATTRMRGLVTKAKEQWQGESDWSTRPTTEVDAPLAPSVPSSQVGSRAGQPQAEERTAGVASPAPSGMAEQILEESEWRVTDRAGTSREHRRSEDTVAPVTSRVSDDV